LSNAFDADNGPADLTSGFAETNSTYELTSRYLSYQVMTKSSKEAYGYGLSMAGVVQLHKPWSL
jgi:hypothetical protein